MCVPRLVQSFHYIVFLPSSVKVCANNFNIKSCRQRHCTHKSLRPNIFQYKSCKRWANSKRDFWKVNIDEREQKHSIPTELTILEILRIKHKKENERKKNESARIYFFFFKHSTHFLRYIHVPSYPIQYHQKRTTRYFSRKRFVYIGYSCL